MMWLRLSRPRLKREAEPHSTPKSYRVAIYGVVAQIVMY
jgi:hypothetical protein